MEIRYLVKVTMPWGAVMYYGVSGERFRGKTMYAERIKKLGFKTKEGAERCYHFKCYTEAENYTASIVPFVV